nr:MAG TPA: hypothetical protein [Caudoviricetes sp.]
MKSPRFHQSPSYPLPSFSHKELFCKSVCQQVTFNNIRPEKSSTAVPCLKGQSFEQSA